MTEYMRLFVGGLPQDIPETELRERFERYGKIDRLEMKNKCDPTGEWLKTFSYINIHLTQQDYQKCRSQLNNTQWKGNRLTIQLAKEDMTAKYARERENDTKKTTANQASRQSDLPVIPTEIKGAVPGTLVPDAENWVVSRYQRVLPIMKIRSKDKKKLIKFDPAARCRQLQKLDREKDDKKGPMVDTTVTELTWSLDADTPNEDPNYKRRIGDFDDLQPMEKKKKSHRSAQEIIREEQAMKAAMNVMEVVSADAVRPTVVASTNGHVRSKFDSDSESATESASPPPNKSATGMKLTKKPKIATPKRSLMKSTKDAGKNTVKTSNNEKLSTAKNASAEKQKNDPVVSLLTYDGLQSLSTTDKTKSRLDSSDSDSPPSKSFLENKTMWHGNRTMSTNRIPSKPKGGGFQALPGFAGTRAFYPAPEEQKQDMNSDTDSGIVSRDKKDASSDDEITFNSASLPTKRDVKTDKSSTSGAKPQVLIEAVSQAEDTSDSESSSEEQTAKSTTGANSKPARKSRPIKKQDKPISSSSESDDSDNEQLKIQPASQKKKVAKKAQSGSLSTSESKHERPASVAKSKQAQKIQPVKKQKKPDSSSSESDDSDKEEPRIQPASQNKIRVKKAESSDSISSSSESEPTKPVSSKEIKLVCSIQPMKKLERPESSSSDDTENEPPTKKNAKLVSLTKSGKDTGQKMSRLNTPSKQPVDSTSSDSDSSSEAAESVAPSMTKRKILTEEKSLAESSSSESEDKSTPLPASPNKRIAKAQAVKSTQQKAATASSSSSSDSDSAPIAKKTAAGLKRGEGRDKFLTASERHKLSNQRRLDALQARQEELKKQQQMIQASLKNPDMVSNKRKVFDSDDDGDDVSAAGETEPSTSSRQKTIFDGSSSEEENYNEMFAHKPQFEGEKGQKLLSMQQSYLDERFKLTEKFIESDDQEEGQPAEVDGDLAEVVDEKRRNLEILQSIVGNRNMRVGQPERKKARKPADTPATVFRDLSSLQYDPADDTRTYLVKPQEELESKPKKPKKKKEGFEPVRAAGEKAPEVSGEKFYEVSVDFKEKKAQNEGATFDFFAESEESGTDQVVKKKTATDDGLFNFFPDVAADEEGNESKEEGEPSGKPAVVKKYENPFAQPEARFEDETDSEEESPQKKGSVSVSQQPAKSLSKYGAVVDWFFFRPDDPRLEDGAHRFYSTLDDATLLRKWKTIKPQLVMNYKQKVQSVTRKSNKPRQSVLRRRKARESGMSHWRRGVS